MLKTGHPGLDQSYVIPFPTFPNQLLLPPPLLIQNTDIWIVCDLMCLNVCLIYNICVTFYDIVINDNQLCC